MTEDPIYLEYILQCIDRIEEYSQGDKEVFFNNSIIFIKCFYFCR